MRPSLLAALLPCLLPGCATPAVPRVPPPAIAAAEVDAREQTADQQVLHALNRLGFGPRPGDAERVRAMGVDRWIALQLQPERVEDRELERFLSGYETLGLSVAQLYERYPPPALVRARARRAAGDDSMAMSDSVRTREAARRAARVSAELVSARVARAVSSERQLEEVMTDFWSNHFNVFIGKNAGMRHLLVSYERDAIRPHALGRFRELLGAVAQHPAMLVYLDNAQNVADSARPTRARGALRARANPSRRRGLNENYARELLELHTLGVDGGYTQQDVVEVARALTGWGVEPPQRGGRFVFRPMVHDAGSKKVLGVPLPAGRGIEDGEQVLDIVARHPSTARFIATKLARRFVSDTPPAALVERAAATFRTTDGDIRATVRVIVTSPEFFSAAAYRAKVKSPFETVVSALRALGAPPDPSPRTAQVVARLGQPLWGHQAPDGWPETGGPWMNTGAILNRINFGLLVASGRVPGARVLRWPEAADLLQAPRETQVDAVIAAFLGGMASPDTRAILLSGEHPLLDGAPPMADSSGVLEGVERPRELRGLAQVIGLALGAPEFQRR